jgi:acetoin utilization deacetylase AcuC-like enzyme
VSNYVYKYNSKDSFAQICQNCNKLKEIYLKIREESKLNKGLYYQREEVFFENCLIHHAFEIVGFIVLNCFGFDKEVKNDLEKILLIYSKYTDNQEGGIYGINSIYYNGLIALKSWESIHSMNIIKREQLKFDFKFAVRKTAIVYNTNCLLHLELPDDPIKRIKKKNELKENPDRFSVLISDKKTGILNNDLFDDPIQFIIKESKREACLNDILKCHDITYLQNIKTKCDNISKKNSLNLINNNNNSKDENTKYKIEKINSDTYISKNTFNIMTSTIGSIFDAIDLVISGECTNAFVIIRPPGHNAGYFGTFENNLNNSNNCIINNACIGAAYARYKYRDNGISKIAIFDYNAFCGKGSEEITQMLNSKVFSKDMNYEKVGKINIRKDKKINWLNFSDAKNILYISTHIQENGSFGNIINNTRENDEIYPAGILNIPFNTKKIYSYDFRNVIRSKVIPRLCKFKPDLIILCSGFDGHELEENDNQMFLQEYDYAFLTEQLQFVADHYSKKMIVSILEEGYNVKSGIISSFAQSIFTHVRYLNLAANMSYIFDVKLKKDERKREYENDLENFKKIERFKNVNIIENKNDKGNEKEEDVDWDIDNNFNINKNYSHNKNVNYKNISDVPKNLIKRKKNKNIS